MGHSEHEDERAADAAMANPEDVEADPDAVEGQPEELKRSPGGPKDEHEQGSGEK